MIFPGAVTQSGARIHTGAVDPDRGGCRGHQDRVPLRGLRLASSPIAAQVVAASRTGGRRSRGLAWSGRSSGPWNVSEALHSPRATSRGREGGRAGKTVADALFPQGGAVGQTVRIKNVPFRVVGVLEAKGGLPGGTGPGRHDRRPYTTVLKRLEGGTAGRHHRRSRGPGAGNRRRVRDGVPAAPAPPPAARGRNNDFMMRSQEEIAAFRQPETRGTISMLLGWRR